MIRLLLTLLALLTGLAAQIGPVQARMRAEGAEFGSVAAAPRSQRAVVARPAAAIPVVNRRWRAQRCPAVMLRKGANCAPPVMVGSDRAHE